ncbi:MAG: MerR family transcriptional regulator [Kordiimonadaceae bacterium]|nr:MerR family transcriptional regulator [Kordiimonadaceae bacterium]
MTPDTSEDDGKTSKSRDAFRTISEVAEYLDLPQHVLRFWESKFAQIKPLKRGGNRRYYRPEDVTLLSAIKRLLHTEGYTIRGVQKLFKAQGVRATIELAVADNDSVFASVRRAASHISVKEEASPYGDVPVGAVAAAELHTILVQLKSIRARLA